MLFHINSNVASSNAFTPLINTRSSANGWPPAALNPFHGNNTTSSSAYSQVPDPQPAVPLGSIKTSSSSSGTAQPFPFASVFNNTTSSANGWPPAAKNPFLGNNTTPSSASSQVPNPQPAVPLGSIKTSSSSSGTGQPFPFASVFNNTTSSANGWPPAAKNPFLSNNTTPSSASSHFPNPQPVVPLGSIKTSSISSGTGQPFPFASVFNNTTSSANGWPPSANNPFLHQPNVEDNDVVMEDV